MLSRRPRTSDKKRIAKQAAEDERRIAGQAAEDEWRIGDERRIAE